MSYNVNLDKLTIFQGIKIYSEIDPNADLFYPYVVIPVSCIRDINGDEIDDVIIGTPGANNNMGAAYVIYGSASYSSDIYLTALPRALGFKIVAPFRDASYIDSNGGDSIGASVSGAGDINNDGINDMIIGASNNGTVFVIYGSTSDLSDIDLATLSPTRGFKIIGGVENGYVVGISVSDLGDINGDGIDDVIVGTIMFNTVGAAVIYGSSYPSDIYLATLSPTQGFKIIGPSYNEQIGISVNSAGDINNDGINDIIIGVFFKNTTNTALAGIAYVIYGGISYSSDLYLENLSPTQGFKIIGNTANGYVGYSVSGVGDVNGDKIDDVIIGAPGINNDRGAAYVIYGSTNDLSDIDLENLPITRGFKIYDDTSYFIGSSVNNVGDINGDKINDMIVGAWMGNMSAVVIYGSSGYSSDIKLATLSSTQGFKFISSSYGTNGYTTAIGGTGDINDDGANDIIFGFGGLNTDSDNSIGTSITYMIYGGNNTCLLYTSDAADD